MILLRARTFEMLDLHQGKLLQRFFIQIIYFTCCHFMDLLQCRMVFLEAKLM